MLQASFWAASLLVVSFVHVASPPLLFLLSFLLGCATDVLWCNIYMREPPHPPTPPNPRLQHSGATKRRTKGRGRGHAAPRYLTEAFPTSVRSTAFGLAMGVGRSGGVLGSALGGAITDIQTAFLLYAASFGVGALLVTLFTFETSRRTLADAVA